jgi:polyisoprenoid-binding protein YceI
LNRFSFFWGSTCAPWRGKCRCLLRLGAQFALVAIAFTGICFGQAPGLYRIDPAASKVEIHVFRSGFLSALGDNHRIALRRLTGTAEGDSVKGWKVHVVGETASLGVLDPDSSPSTREEVQRTMLGPEQMDVQRFPKIEIESTAARLAKDKQTWTLETDLTLHGVTRQVDFPIAWNQAGDTLHVTGKKSLRLRDFNIEPINRGLGAVKVRNDFEVDYDIALRRR